MTVAGKAPPRLRLVQSGPKGPTADEIEALRRLDAAAGSAKELERWIRLARQMAPSRKGRKRGFRKCDEYDEMALRVAQTLHLLSGCKISLHAILRRMVDKKEKGPLCLTRERGASEDAVVARVEARERAERPANDIDYDSALRATLHASSELLAWLTDLDRPLGHPGPVRHSVEDRIRSRKTLLEIWHANDGLADLAPTLRAWLAGPLDLNQPAEPQVKLREMVTAMLAFVD